MHGVELVSLMTAFIKQNMFLLFLSVSFLKLCYHSSPAWSRTVGFVEDSLKKEIFFFSQSLSKAMLYHSSPAWSRTVGYVDDSFKTKQIIIICLSQSLV